MTDDQKLMWKKLSTPYTFTISSLYGYAIPRKEYMGTNMNTPQEEVWNRLKTPPVIDSKEFTIAKQKISKAFDRWIKK